MERLLPENGKLEADFAILNDNAFLFRIDVETYEKLAAMGFRKRMAGEALRQAENDMNAALEILRVTSRVSSPADDLVDNIEDALFDRTKRYSTDELAQLVSNWFVKSRKL